MNYYALAACVVRNASAARRPQCRYGTALNSTIKFYGIGFLLVRYLFFIIKFLTIYVQTLRVSLISILLSYLLPK